MTQLHVVVLKQCQAPTILYGHFCCSTTCALSSDPRLPACRKPSQPTPRFLRLKALTLTYQNAWWDSDGRKFEEEFGTGIIDSYKIVRQTKGANAAEQPTSWVQWSQPFAESLKRGNVKRLDIDKLFSLRLPTAQRMYRFLDKRMYKTDTFEMDLIDFACGHIGITKTTNVARIKERLAPAISELQEAGFLEKASPEERYTKIGPGKWRIHVCRKSSPPRGAAPTPVLEAPSALLDRETRLVQDFYRLWDATDNHVVTDRERSQAQDLLARDGHETVEKLLPKVVRRMKAKFPDAKYFGASIR